MNECRSDTKSQRPVDQGRPDAPLKPQGSAVARIASELLLAGASEVEIDHHGTLYRLRQTSLGKLILTK